MDVKDIRFPDNHFDLAVDKSTIDALLCGERSFISVAIMMKEVQRVLKEGGIYIIISYGAPQNRIFHLEREHLSFDINIFTIKKDYSVENDNHKFEKMHYVYVCRKRSGADGICKENFEKVMAELEVEEKIEQEYYYMRSSYNNCEKGHEDEEDDFFDDDFNANFLDDRFSSEDKENSDF